MTNSRPKTKGVRYERGYYLPIGDQVPPKRNPGNTTPRKKRIGKIHPYRYKITDREYKQLVVRYYTARMYDTYSFEEYFHAMAKKIVRTIGEAQYGDTLVTLRG